MQYDFDQDIDRSHTGAMSLHGFKDYSFGFDEEIVLPYSADELITMWVADMEFRTAKPIIDAIKKRAEHGIFGYTQIFDIKIKETFIDWVASRHNWTFDAEHIVPSSGVIPALNTFADICCDRDGQILILTPSYAFFQHAADMSSVSTVYSKLIYQDGVYKMDFDDIELKLQNERIRLTYFCHPHNPTGRNWTESELLTFGNLCAKYDVTIISDEIHCDLLRVGETFIPLQKVFPESRSVITCMSPSKTFNLAGLQFAFIVIPDEEILAKWKEKHFPIVNPLSLSGAQAAYQHGELWLGQLRYYLDDNLIMVRDFLRMNLPEAKFTIPKATYLAWIDVSAYFSGQNLSLFFARQAGVILEGGDMFLDNAQGFIRLNVASPRERLLRALVRIADSIHRMGKK